ncbi:MAG: redoxin domain-containing protein, partial [Thermoflavifilum sp.]|nr:redoxin domain-containing protein [Thermoflavifilum sp.]
SGWLAAIFWALSLTCIRAIGQEQSGRFYPMRKIGSLPLLNLSGKQIQLNSIIQQDSFDVFVFLSPECPLCQNYSLTLNQLYLQFSHHPIAWIGIVPGKGFKRQEVQDFVNRFQIRFPVYIDPAMQLTHFLNAKITPQVMLFNREGWLLYNGAIDNWAVSLGKQRTVITAYYLLDALNSCLKGMRPAISYTTPVGCYINDF